MDLDKIRKFYRKCVDHKTKIDNERKTLQEKLQTVEDKIERKELEYKIKNIMYDREYESALKAMANETFSAKDTDVRELALTLIARLDPETAVDVLRRVKDAHMFIPSESGIKLMLASAHIKAIPIAERMLVGVFLQQIQELEAYIKFFSDILDLADTPIQDKLECCKYLINSESEKATQRAIEYLKNYINDPEINSIDKYKTIVSYISSVGITSFYIYAPIPIQYNEQMCKELQLAFYTNTANGVRERILSAQYLLQIEAEEAPILIKDLFSIANDNGHEEDIRADALDVVLRLGDEESKAEAQQLLKSLGGEDGTLYDDGQNVHNESIQASVNAIILKMHEEYSKLNIEMRKLHETLSKLIDSSDRPAMDKAKCYKTLDRIYIDTATFTSAKITLPILLGYVVEEISTDESHRDDLFRRLLDEFIDMSGTCSSGYSSRLVNVLSGYKYNIEISYEHQLKANVKGRVMAIISKLEEDEQETMMMMEYNDKYLQIRDRIYKNLYEELRSEFVVDGEFMKIEEFDRGVAQEFSRILPISE